MSVTVYIGSAAPTPREYTHKDLVTDVDLRGKVFRFADRTILPDARIFVIDNRASFNNPDTNVVIFVRGNKLERKTPTSEKFVLADDALTITIKNP